MQISLLVILPTQQFFLNLFWFYLLQIKTMSPNFFIKKKDPVIKKMVKNKV